ncbi:MAG TPA: amidohydrolase, partial [Spongiibacteraceae bacterium]|nr:amidohydrolase [Spongiibacteraceae bacterium]
MPTPKDIQAIDLMMGIPVSETNQEWYEAFKPLLMDEESRQMFKMPAQYMFRDVPQLDKLDDYLDFTVGQMDKHNIEVALVGFDDNSATALAAQQRHPARFMFDYSANPN